MELKKQKRNNREKKRLNISISAVDLFCGIGGLSYGLKKTGIDVVAGIDIDKSCQYAYEANNAPFINKSISSVSTEEMQALYGKNDVKILVGCAPCQTFSKHTLKVQDRSKSDKWRLLDDFAEKIRKIHPEIVSMENVPQLRSYDVFRDFLKVLEEEGYFISHEIIYCPKYGIPQTRSRLVLLASLYGEIKLVPKTHNRNKYSTVRQTIESLEKLKTGAISSKDTLHRAAKLSDINLKRIRQSKPGGSWKDWDKELLTNCHRKETGQTYSAVYGRMEWNKPSPTITTQFYSFGTGRFGHPEQDRALSLREGALLQTFPKKYKFFAKNEEIHLTRLGRHIGNAVPVRLGEIIGQSIKKHIKEHYE